MGVDMPNIQQAQHIQILILIVQLYFEYTFFTRRNRQIRLLLSI